MELCKNFTTGRWRELRQRIKVNDEKAWLEAIDVFERRLRERFFRCIDALLNTGNFPKSDGPIVPGFCVMALCCLLVETLQSFYRGGREKEPDALDASCTYPNGKCMKQPSTARAFKDFLANSRHFRKDFRNNEIRGDFAENVRNALLHEAETRKGWLIRQCQPSDRIVSGRRGMYILNRTKFYEALSAEFKDYLGRLRDPSNGTHRERFLAKMDSLCVAAPEIE